jgi:uncharacterized protein with GYD domain
LQASYTADGTKGLIKEGGSKRRAAVQKMVEQAGGKLLSMYYALGENDVYVISDLPDQTAALAISLTINASGAVKGRSTLLVTPEEIDAAAKKSVSYRPPGA